MPNDVNQSEPTIFEILQPLIEHWKLLFLGILVAMIVGAMINFFSKKQFETALLLDVGAVQEKALEDPNTVAMIINSDAYRQKIASKVGIQASSTELRKMIQADIDTQRPSSLISVHVISDQPEKAVRLARAVADDIIERHKPFYDDRMQTQISYQKVLEAAIHDYSTGIEKAKEEMELFKSTHDVSGILTAQTKLNDSQGVLMWRRKELLDLQVSLSRPQTRRTSVVAPPSFPLKPLRTSLILTLLVAAVVSFFVMTSYILISDQYQRSRLRV